MFAIIIGLESNGELLSYGSEWTAIIEGCPTDGVEAIDFRRAHGLPDGPSNRIALPGYAFGSEALVRALPDAAIARANISLDSYQCGQVEWFANAEGDVLQRGRRTLRGYGGYNLVVGPDVLAAYCREQNPLTAEALLRDVLAYPQRSRAAAEREAARIRAAREEAAEAKRQEEAARERARDLLADELRDLRERCERAEREAAYWRAEASAAHEEPAEDVVDDD